MKILKPRYDLLLPIFPVFILISLASYFFYFPLLTKMANINWLCNLLLCFILFSSRRKLKLGNEQSLPLLKWLSFLFVIQLMLNLILWGSCHFFYNISKTESSLPSLDYLQFSLSAGLFPFGFMLLTALTLAYFTYTKNQSGTLATAYQTFFKNTDTDTVGIAVNTYMRSNIYFTWAFLLGMLAMQLIYLWSFWSGINMPFGLNLAMAFTCSGLIILTRQHYTVKTLQQLHHWKVPDWLLLALFSFFASIVYFLMSLIANFLVLHNPFLNQEFLPFNVKYLPEYQQLTVTFIGFGLSMVTGGIIAACSKGRSVFEIVSASFITNILCLLIIYGLKQIVKLTNFSILPLLINIVCMLTALAFLLSKKYVTYFMRATIPNADVKLRSTYHLVRSLPLITIGFITTFVAMNAYFLAIGSVLIVLPCVVVMLIAVLSLIITWILQMISERVRDRDGVK